MPLPVEFDERSLSISETAWNDLIENGTDIAFGGVVAAAKEVVANGGHFMLISEVDSLIMRRIDRGYELQELIEKAEKARQSRNCL